MTYLVDTEFFQLVRADEHQAIGQVLPVFFEHFFIVQAVDGMGNFSKALKTTEIVKAIHNENSES
ncbi:hypothetical protein D3C75_1278100 [compost metagenome]